MRTGIPIVPILRQQRSSDSSTGKQRPSSAGRQGVLHGSARREATADGGTAAQQAGHSLPHGASTVTPPSGSLLALGLGARAVPGPVLRQGPRKSAGGIGRRTPNSARASFCRAGSTGGTGSSTAISGSCAPSLSDFWSNIDGLDTDLQMRAEKMKSGGRHGRPSDRSIASSRLMGTPGTRTPEIAPTSLDVVFPHTPESSFKDETSGSSPDGHATAHQASARMAWTPSRPEVLPDDSPQPSLCSSSQESRHSPRPTNLGASVAGSATSSTFGQRHGQTPPGRRPLRRQTSSGATVGQLTERIRELEGELETTFENMMRRNPQTRRKRSGSAPPRITRLARQSASRLHKGARQTPRTTPHSTPEATPRILCRDTLAPSADASSFVSQPSRLWHICQMMQLERRQLLDTIRQVCEQCGVQSSSSNSAGCDSEGHHHNGQPELPDPRTLLLHLRDQHLALRAQCAAGATPNPARLSIQSDLSDLSGFSGAPCESSGGQSCASAAPTPLAAGTAALQTLLEGCDERNAFKTPALEDAITRRDLAALIASAQRAERIFAPVLTKEQLTCSLHASTDLSESHSAGDWAEAGLHCSHDQSELIKVLKKTIGPGIHLAVLGEARFSDAASECIVKAAAGELSAAMGAHIQFITCGRHGAQECFARHCGDGARVWNLHPVGQESSYCFGRAINAGSDEEQCKDIFLQLADIYITIEGGPAVAEEARLAQARGALVLPLRRSGWASGGMFGFPGGALNRPSFAREDHWEQLGSKSAPVGSSAAALVAVVVAFAHEQRRVSLTHSADAECDGLTLDAAEEHLAEDDDIPSGPLHSGSLALSPSTAPPTPWSTAADVVECGAPAGDARCIDESSSVEKHWPVEAPQKHRVRAAGREYDIITEDTAGQLVSSAGPALFPTISPASSCCSMPAAGRLCELIEDKTREVFELQARCDRASTGEEGIEAATLLAAAREELRLLREFAGIEGGAGGACTPPISDDGAPVTLNFRESTVSPERRAAVTEDVHCEEGLLQRAKHGLANLMHLEKSQDLNEESSNEAQEEHKESLFFRAKHGLAHMMHLDHNEEIPVAQ